MDGSAIRQIKGSKEIRNLPGGFGKKVDREQEEICFNTKITKKVTLGAK